MLVDELQEPGSTFAGLDSSPPAAAVEQTNGSSAVADSPAPFMHLSITALSSKLFDLGALPSTRGRNREALYAVSKEMEKAERMRLKKIAGEMQFGGVRGCGKCSGCVAAAGLSVIREK